MSSSRSDDVFDRGGVPEVEEEELLISSVISGAVSRNKSSLAINAPEQSILTVPGSIDCKFISSLVVILSLYRGI